MKGLRIMKLSIILQPKLKRVSAEIQKWESFLIAYKVYTEFGTLKNRFYNSPEAEPSV